jgi:benzoyl-CoA-dihydrodiol lyase
MNVTFQRHPSSYNHWNLAVDGAIATVTLGVNPEVTMAEGYELKLNSYDLGVDIELADLLMRLRFEHPGVACVVLRANDEKVWCAGANILMLRSSTHHFKVNFCKFTNETRFAIEDAQNNSGQHWIAAVRGVCAGGGYELAACANEILLADDGRSAVSLPEVPLLGVLPGTGGLTRVVDKRKVRRDHADVFSTLSDGLRAKRAEALGR